MSLSPKQPAQKLKKRFIKGSPNIKYDKLPFWCYNRCTRKFYQLRRKSLKKLLTKSKYSYILHKETERRCIYLT